MAESTLDTVSVTDWKMIGGYLNDDGDYILNKGGLLGALDTSFTTLDDGDPVTAGALTLIATPAGGNPASVGSQVYPASEDTDYDLAWTPSQNGTYLVAASVTTFGGQGPLETTAITLKVRSWTEAEADPESHTEQEKAADTHTEASASAETHTELSKDPDSSTEAEKASDSNTEKAGG